MSGPLDLTPEAFLKQDSADDSIFYAPARLMTHIDDGAIAALSRFYGDHLANSGVILDLMSSWVSHLPSGLAPAEVIGQGMNAEELAANPRLTRRIVHDLNRSPTLPIEDRSCDAALCCVGVQYLQRPIEVFTEVARVLRDHAPFIVTFSNRCFPTKAVAIWTALGVKGKAELIELYLRRSGFGEVAVDLLADGRVSDPLVAVTGRARAAVD